MHYHVPLLYHVKDSARKTVRELTVCILIVTAFFALRAFNGVDVLLDFCVFGLPGGILVWVLYRLTRFTAGY